MAEKQTMSDAYQTALPRKTAHRMCALIVGAIAVIIVALIAIAAASHLGKKGGMTAADAKKLVASIPLRSDRATVEARLDALKIRHDFWEGDSEDEVGHTRVSSKAGMNSRLINGTVVATIDNANLDLLYPGDITLYFYFDKDDHLIGTYVLPFVYNP